MGSLPFNSPPLPAEQSERHKDVLLLVNLLSLGTRVHATLGPEFGMG